MLPDSSQGKEELKPCPFCGKDEANIGITRYQKGSDFERLNGCLELFFVSCAWCGGNSSNITGGTKEEAKAIAKWNAAHCWKALSQSQKDAEDWKGQAEMLAEFLKKALIGNQTPEWFRESTRALSAFQRLKEAQEKK